MKRFSIVCVAIAMLVSCNAKDKTTETKVQEQQVPTTKVVEITQAQFAELVSDYTGEWQMKSDIPVIVDFNATWCGPCRRLAPVLEQLAKEYDGKIKFYSIDVDKNKPLAQAFQVRSIPMLLLCPVNGQPQQIVGLYPKEEIVKAIDYLFFPAKE